MPICDCRSGANLSPINCGMPKESCAKRMNGVNDQGSITEMRFRSKTMNQGEILTLVSDTVTLIDRSADLLEHDNTVERVELANGLRQNLNSLMLIESLPLSQAL